MIALENESSLCADGVVVVDLRPVPSAAVVTPNTSAHDSKEGLCLNMDGALGALFAITLGVSEEKSWASLISAGVLTVRDLDNVDGKLLQQRESKR
jgi:hypothetical protein